MDSIECLGLVASCLTTFAFLPQVLKTWKTRSADDFSLPTLLLLGFGTLFWVIYGVMRAMPAVWLGNSVTLALAGSILIMKLRLPTER